MWCILSENISVPKTETLRWSAITLLKDTFRPSNIDILKPKGISFPTMYNTKCPTFDTKLTQSHGLDFITSNPISRYRKLKQSLTSSTYLVFWPLEDLHRAKYTTYFFLLCLKKNDPKIFKSCGSKKPFL